MGVLNLLAMNSISKHSKEVVDKELPILIADQDLKYNIMEIRALIRGYLLFDDDSLKQFLYDVIDDGEKTEESVLQLTQNDKIKKIIDEKGEWESYILDAVEVYDSGDKEKAIQMVLDGNETVQNINEEINELVNKREQIITDSGEQSIKAANANMIFVGILILIVIIISIVAALITSRSISRPVIRVMERMNEVAKGVLNLDPLKVTTNDETARLTEATNTMTENNRELLLSIQEVSETVSSQSEELTQSASEVKSATEQVATTMEELAAGTEVLY